MGVVCCGQNLNELSGVCGVDLPANNSFFLNQIFIFSKILFKPALTDMRAVAAPDI